MTETDAGKPRYRQLAELLISRIEQGRYPVDSGLPSEQELCAEFDVSHYTIREALRVLTVRRYVRRRQGSGSVVISANPRAGYQHTMRSLTELFEYAEDTRLKLEHIRMIEANDNLAELLGRLPGRRWLASEGVRRARGGDPINFTRVYLHEDFESAADDLARIAGPVYRMLEERFGATVAEVAQEIAAEPFPADAARALGAAPGATAIRITRRYLDETDRPLFVSINWHPSETFNYAMRLKREEVAE